MDLVAVVIFFLGNSRGVVRFVQLQLMCAACWSIGSSSWMRLEILHTCVFGTGRCASIINRFLVNFCVHTIHTYMNYEHIFMAEEEDGKLLV